MCLGVCQLSAPAVDGCECLDGIVASFKAGSASGLAAEQLMAMADTFQVQLELEGQTHTFPCQSDQTVLAAAEAANLTLPSSCCAGVCTTCAASIRSGELHQPDAMGVKEELRQKGFALLCVAQPRSDVQLLAGQEDALYEAQFGQYQK